MMVDDLNGDRFDDDADLRDDDGLVVIVIDDDDGDDDVDLRDEEDVVVVVIDDDSSASHLILNLRVTLLTNASIRLQLSVGAIRTDTFITSI